MRLIQFLLVPTLLFCLVMALVAPASAQDEKESGELEKLKAASFEFEVMLAELHKPLEELDENYRGYLEKQKNAYQLKGQLKAMLAVEDEQNTFESEPAEELATFPELSRLQKIYREQRETREQSLVEPKRKLITHYRKMIEEMAVAWTKKGEIEAAKMALAEAERLAAMAEGVEVAKPTSRIEGKTEGDLAGKAAGEVMINGLGMELCWIPAGEFTMGSPEDEVGRDAGKEAQVEVELTHGYWMGKYEVTQEEYKKVTGTNTSSFKQLGERAPVDRVSWPDAVAFCEALTEREQGSIPEGWAYRLPTEAQWEYACRAGEKGPYSGGTLDEVGWYKLNSGGNPHEVGTKMANAWGLHDVHGNLREWCQDWFAFVREGGKDPVGPSTGTFRAIRGGCWNYGDLAGRAAFRGGQPITAQVFDIGFRVYLGPSAD